jgi:protein SCO1/2
MKVVTVLLLLLVCVPAGARTSEKLLEDVAFQQRIGEPLPADALFRNSAGEPVRLSELAQGRPLLLLLSWFECPNLCPMMLEQLAESARALPFGPAEYKVAVVSIDPGESPAQARKVAQRMGQKYGSVTARWEFLSGEARAIDSVAGAVGFQYAYDQQDDRYAHPAGVVVVSPGGRINRYLFGLKPNTPDLKLGLLDASQGKLGSAVDQVVLRCYRFSPDSGQYNLAVVRLIQVVGSVFVVIMFGVIIWLWRREAK